MKKHFTILTLLSAAFILSTAAESAQRVAVKNSSTNVMPSNEIIQNTLDEPSSITLLQSYEEGPDTVYEYLVNCKQIKDRKVIVRKNRTLPASCLGISKGTIALFTGQFGKEKYNLGPGTPRGNTWNSLIQGCFETFGVEWEGALGFITNGSGAGLKNQMCGVPLVMQKIRDLASNSQTFCAQGNSMGGEQIAYALSYYGMENLIDVAMFTAGPPVPDVYDYCFGNPQPVPSPSFDEGSITMNISYNWNTCNTVPPPPVCIAPSCDGRVTTPAASYVAQKSSLITPLLPAPDYNFPNTLVVQAGSELDPYTTQGQKYLSMLTGPKLAPIVNVGQSEHSFDNTTFGANVVKTTLLNNCHDQTP